jgi:1-acyl-sn-glycerol-3-phosphate acyltransferase
MEPIFTGDSYDTPQESPRFLGDRLALGTRLYHSYLLARIVLESRRLALRGEYDDAEWVRSSVRSVREQEGCGARFHIRGLENIRGLSGPTVIIGNHMSTLETFALPCIIQPVRPVTFVVKEDLARHPFFGPIMRSRDPVVVGRRNPREDLEAVLVGGAERLARGISIIIFPQSTRMPHFDPSAFNSLGVKLAKRANVPFLPLALKTDFWGNGRFLKDFGPLHRREPVHFAFGQAERVRGNGAEQHQAVVAFIQSHLAEWAGTASGSA